MYVMTMDNLSDPHKYTKSEVIKNIYRIVDRLIETDNFKSIIINEDNGDLCAIIEAKTRTRIIKCTKL